LPCTDGSMFGTGPGFAAVAFGDADDDQGASFPVDLLKLQIRVFPGNVVLEPLIEEDVGRTQFPFNLLRNGAHQVALFPGQGERHLEPFGDLTMEHEGSMQALDPGGKWRFRAVCQNSIGDAIRSLMVTSETPRPPASS